MKRVDRVMDLLELLKVSGTTTVDRLARTQSVSRRTVLRDLATLRERGWPIRSESGPGGWRVPGT
jgi:predicted DNA-binding transcriptional regulator YafY